MSDIKNFFEWVEAKADDGSAFFQFLMLALVCSFVALVVLGLFVYLALGFLTYGISIVLTFAPVFLYWKFKVKGHE